MHTRIVTNTGMFTGADAHQDCHQHRDTHRLQSPMRADAHQDWPRGHALMHFAPATIRTRGKEQKKQAHSVGGRVSVPNDSEKEAEFN